MKITKEIVNRGSALLNDLWDEVALMEEPPESDISGAIRDVLGYKAKTYKYIMLTQLLGKALDGSVNILAMQESSSLPDSWAPRTLCEKVITMGGFEKNVLMNVLGGSKQPYNSTPGQFPELSKENHTRKSDIPIRDEMIDALSSIETSGQATDAIRYYLYVCSQQVRELGSEEPLPEISRTDVSCARVRKFLFDLADIGHEGEGLSIAIATLMQIAHGDDGCHASLYQINTSRAGHGDIDVFFGGDGKYASIEVKDRQFTPDEVRGYAKAAFEAGWPRFAFVYGHNAGSPGPVFTTKETTSFAERGQIATCVAFDALLDSVMLTVLAVDLDELRAAVVGFIADSNASPDTTNPARQLLRELLAEFV